MKHTVKALSDNKTAKRLHLKINEIKNKPHLLSDFHYVVVGPLQLPVLYEPLLTDPHLNYNTKNEVPDSVQVHELFR